MTKHKASSAQSIQFILDGEVINLTNPNPQMSVLSYCRETLLKTGTHEGCAEGDCGACTVVIAELNADGQLIYKNINACILLLPMLQGKALFTVESLGKEGELHPVQQAMVDHHASQCGFCTPGFVMSLFALFQGQQKVTRALISTTLSGNLCRCTGYKPIIEAALHMHEYDVSAHFEQSQKELKEQLLSINDINSKGGSSKKSQSKRIEADGLTTYMPSSIEELCELKQQHESALIVAGNTDVGLWLNKQLKDIKTMLLINQIDALKSINFDQGELTIAAAVSVYDAFECLVQHFPSLADLARRFASQPVCHAATLVGNIANGSPIGDSAPILMALGARVRVRSVSGFRDIDLEHFYLGYQQKDLKTNEFVESVTIPIHANKDKNIACYKISKRFDQDISAVTMALVVGINNDNVETCQIAFGGMAATTQRAYKTEAVLMSNKWGQHRITLAQRFLEDDFKPLDDLRATSGYRMQVAKNLLQRFFIETAYPDVATSVFQREQS